MLGMLEHARALGWRVSSSGIHSPLGPGEQRAPDAALGELFAPGLLTGKNPHPLSLAVPVVDCGEDPGPTREVPRVQLHHGLVGELAAQHLRATGQEHYFLLGRAEHSASREQLEGFATPLRRAGFSVESNLLDAAAINDWPEQLREWLASLPKRSAVYCVDDELGLQVCLTCTALGRAVPGEVAVLACGNDPWLCALAAPELSSIALPHRSIGRTAATLLEQLLRGERVPRQLHQVAPLEVVARGSTLTYAAAPAAVQRALAFMREHAQRGIRIQDVLDHARLSRRSLEQYSQQLLGHSPHQELIRLRLSRARRLLETSNLPLLEIARSAGFSDGRQMSETFRRELSLTPSQYRRARREALRDPEELPR
jgi:LacI family transcriptional regulator